MIEGRGNLGSASNPVPDSTGPLHILQVTSPAAFGGLESVVFALTTGLRDRGHRLRVIAETGGAERHPFVESLRQAGIEVLVPGKGSREESRLIGRLVAAGRVDVVHTHGYRADILSGFIRSDLGGRTVSTVHGFTGGNLKVRIYERIQRAMLRRLDGVVAVSRPLEALLRSSGIRPARLHLIPNAFRAEQAFLSRSSARERLGLPAGARIIGWVGRLSPEKAPDVMLAALSLLSRDDWVAIFLGDGPALPALKRRASELGLGDRVRWPGTVPQAAALFGAFDVLAQSSRTEGTPMVLLEAMSAGVPVVATAVGGIPDLLGSGACGWLVPPDDPESLAAALGAVLSDAATRDQRVASARDHLARAYDPETWLSRYESVYRQVVVSR